MGTSKDNESSGYSWRDRGWIVSFIGIISLVRVGNGLFASMSGPTLLYLADNVGSTVGQVSLTFTARSIGQFIGSVAYGFIMNRFPNFKAFLVCALGIIFNGALMLITPWVTNLPGLIVTTAITGLMFGYLDSAMQSLYLNLWGEKNSRPYMQSFHFAFSVGALLAPIVAAPFLQMADQLQSADDSCPNVKTNEIMTTIAYNVSSTTDSTSSNPPGLNPVAWTYIISGVYTLVMGIIMLALAIVRIDERLKVNRELSTESREEEPLKNLIWLFLPLTCCYFTLVSLEVVYQSYIYSVSLCSEIKFSVTDASTLNTLFWAGFGLGRGSGIFYANYFKPTTMIIYDLLGATLGIVLLSIFGRDIELTFWFVTFFFGFAIATLYSSGVSYLSTITNMSMSYVGVFAIGNTLGAMSMPPAAGAIFDEYPFGVVYFLCGLAVLNDIFFVWLFYAGKRHSKKIQRATSRAELVLSEQGTKL